MFSQCDQIYSSQNIVLIVQIQHMNSLCFLFIPTASSEGKYLTLRTSLFILVAEPNWKVPKFRSSIIPTSYFLR